MIKKNKNTKIIIKEAEKLGIKAKIIYPKRRLIELSRGSKKFLVQQNFRINLSRFGTRNVPLLKDLSYFFWQKNNIPIPKTVAVFSFQEAKREIKRIPFPLVIKDARSSQSKNLWVNVSNRKKALLILKKLFSNSWIEAVIVQEFIQNNEFRILILKDKILGMAQLIPPFLIGNGKSTVKELIQALERKIKCKITIDQEMKNLIKSQEFSSSSILPANQKLFLREYSKLKEGGKIKNLPLDIIHPEMKKMCLRAVKVTGLGLAGLDIMTGDLSRSPREQKIKFIEVNGRPDIYIHHLPDEGKPTNVTKEILKYIFKL